MYFICFCKETFQIIIVQYIRNTPYPYKHSLLSNKENRYIVATIQKRCKNNAKLDKLNKEVNHKMQINPRKIVQIRQQSWSQNKCLVCRQLCKQFSSRYIFSWWMSPSGDLGWALALVSTLLRFTVYSHIKPNLFMTDENYVGIVHFNCFSEMQNVDEMEIQRMRQNMYQVVI